MPLRTLLRYKNPDISADVNRRLRDLVTKGVFLGGQVNPVAGTLDVSVPSLGAVGADGMVTVLEGVAETLTCTAGLSQWVLLHSYYVANDLPVSALEVLSELAYDALSADEQNHRVKLARVTLGAAVTEVTSDDISYVDSERIDPLARSPFRGTVATRTDLPDWSDPPSGITRSNQPYDLYFVEDERIFYTWGLAGTPAWQRVISALEEFELASHKNNEDDGTVAPDFFEAQHVDVIHRQALDAGSASQVQHGSEGTAFGTANPFVDSALPLTALVRDDFTGLLSVTSVQLSGTYYVGTGTAGTATSQFRMATYQDARVLLAGDRRPLTVLRVKTSDDAAELDPSVHADALGYYADPIVEIDFTLTSQANYSGNLSVYGRAKWALGELQPGNASLEAVGLGFVRAAEDIPVHNNAFTEISGSLDVQEALEDLDAVIAGLAGGADETLKKIVNLGSLAGGPDPDELNWYGGTAAALGRLDDDSDNPRVNALANDLYFRVDSGQQYVWFVDTASIASLEASGSDARLSATAGNLAVNAPTGQSFLWAFNGGTVAALNVASGNPQLSAASEDFYYNVPTGKTHEWRVNSGTEMTLAAGSLTVVGTVLSSGVNTGGSATPSSGNAIVSGGLAVGFDTDPAADEVQVGDAAFALAFDGTDPYVRFDTSGGTDQLWYDRSGNALFLDIGGSTELIADPNGLRVGGGLYVGSTGTAPSSGDIAATNYVYANNRRFVFGVGTDDWIEYNDTTNTLSFTLENAVEYTFSAAALDVSNANITSIGTVGCAQVQATNYVQSTTFQLDSTDKMVFTASTSVAWTVNNVEELRLRTDGLGVNKGLHVGTTGGTIYDNDIVVSGGLVANGTTNPAAGDGIFTGGLVVGSDSAPTANNIDVAGDIFVTSGVNVGGGTTNPTAGDGIFSGGLVVGADAAPNGGDIRMTGGLQVGGSANPDAGTGIFSTVVSGRDANQAVSSIKGYFYGATVGSSATGTILLTEATGASYLNMLSDTSAGLLVGDGAAAGSGSLVYTHSSDQWDIGAGGNPTVVLQSTQMAVGNSPSIAASAALAVDSTTRGFLPPRMSTSERTSISTPAEGLIVFDTTASALYVYQGAAWHSINVT